MKISSLWHPAKGNVSQAILEAHADENGDLQKYAWPGGYPMYYRDAVGTDLCPECASVNDEFNEPVDTAAINWEDPSLNCDGCSARIPSAYAEDEADKKAD